MSTEQEKEKETKKEEELVSAETLTKNSRIGQFLSKGSYIALFLVETAVCLSDNIPVSLQILICALGSIIIGSFGSLRHPQSAEAKEVERLSPKDAYLFPVMGSIVLFSFYVFIKYLPTYLIDYATQAFFTIISSFAVQGLIDEIAKEFMPSFLYKITDINIFSLKVTWKLLYSMPITNKEFYLPSIALNPNNNNNNIHNDNVTIINFTRINFISLILGGLVAISWYIYDEFWLFTNIIGLSLSIQAISFLNPGSYYTAFILLSLLFFYDIFWVFGTDVMVTVAKNLKAPIKLVFPRPAVQEKPNMLGLGDIVLPGIYIALLLRYDVLKSFVNITNVQNLKKNMQSLNINTFLVCIVCYAISLGLCLVIMWYFDHAQPALLYLVPGVIIPVLLLAYYRGDFYELWSYDEEPEQSDKKKQ